MRIDLRKIKRAGKDSESFCFEFTPSDDIITLPDTTFAEPVKVTGEVKIAGSDAVVSAEVWFKLSGQCSRCLEPAWFEDAVILNEDFVPEPGDGENYTYSKDVVDLTQAVTELLIISMPMVLLCKSDCEGIEMTDENK